MFVSTEKPSIEFINNDTEHIYLSLFGYGTRFRRFDSVLFSQGLEISKTYQLSLFKFAPQFSPRKLKLLKFECFFYLKKRTEIQKSNFMKMCHINN